MNAATTTALRLLRVSTTRVDGGCVFGALPKDRWEPALPPDRQNRVALGNYCLLIRHAVGWILVNTGPGDKAPLDFNLIPVRSRSSLLRELRDAGLAPKDIGIVVMTHLQDEYAGGGTHITSSGRVLPTFPYARYLVQKEAVQEALHPNERSCRSYRPDDVRPLMESSQLQMLEGVKEIAAGVWVEPAPGPTAGHQAVFVEHDGRTSAFVGSLVPTVLHLSSPVVSASDWSPEQSTATKRVLFQRAIANAWDIAPAGVDGWLTAPELGSRVKQQQPQAAPRVRVLVPAFPSLAGQPALGAAAAAG